MFAVRARAGVDFVRCDRAERLPKSQQRLRLGFVDVKRFDRQATGQLFDLAVSQSGGVRAAVKDADGFDFVFVSLNNASDFAVYVESVISFARRQLKLAHGDAESSRDVHVGHILNNPAALSELLVDVLTCFVFGSHLSQFGKAPHITT